MLLKEPSQQRHDASMEVSPKVGQYPGLMALSALPEHANVHFISERGAVQVSVDNKDGYSVMADLRKPDQTVFRGHQAKLIQSVGQLILKGDITIQAANRQIKLLEAFQTAFPQYQPATIALEASSDHLQHFPKSNDVFARALFYASRGELNPRGNTANHQESNSVRLDVFPSTDLTLFFLVHELVELITDTAPLSQRVSEAKAESNQAYHVAKELLISKKMIDESEKGMALMQKILELASRSNGKDEMGNALIDSAIKHHWYMATKKMVHADKERSTNERAFSFMVDTIPGLESDNRRIERLKSMVSVLNRWHDRQVMASELQMSDITSQLGSYDFDSFFASRQYDAPVESLDATLRTWLASIKAFVK